MGANRDATLHAMVHDLASIASFSILGPGTPFALHAGLTSGAYQLNQIARFRSSLTSFFVTREDPWNGRRKLAHRR
jgi:hypothetical protein